MIINIKTSRLLTVAVLIAYLGGGVAAVTSALPAPLVVVVSIGLLYGLVRTLATHARRIGAAAVTCIEWSGDDIVHLQFANGRRVAGCRPRYRWVVAGLVIVVFRCGAGMTVNVVIARDAVEAESLRRLRALLVGLPPA